MSILFWDAVGAPFDGNTPKTVGLGGSELAQIQLAEALAERGHDVQVLVARDENREPRTIRGVTYGQPDLSKVRTVIASRMTFVPAELSQGRQVIVSLTDMGPHKIARCDLVVGVSRWQVDRFKASLCPRKVIPPIVETAPRTNSVPGRFVYASAHAKGLDATLAAWANVKRYLPPGAHLRVTTAGWDLPEEGSVEASGAEWLGVLTPEGIRAEIASAVGLFYVNTYPETFCAIAAIAEASGTHPVIYCSAAGNDPATGLPWTKDAGMGALPTTLTTPLCRSQEEFITRARSVAQGDALSWAAKNYSKKKVVQSWENILRV